jgi:hypothetical protein
MRFTKNDGNGEAEIDHKASPGLPPNMARRMGFNPSDVGEGTVHRAATAFCPHCGSHVMLNPLRQRERNCCFKCNSYICDGCAAIASTPDYQHLTFAEIAEKVQSGRFTIAGTSMSTLRLVPIGDDSNG